jgi:hypothetical protein
MPPCSTVRSAILDVRVAVVLAGALSQVPTVAMAQLGYAQKPVPYGLGATIKYDITGMDPKVFRNPYIRGVGFQIHWSDIEPARGEPDWAPLDELFAAAQVSHKWVHLYVFAGFFSPAWALQGAETGQFTVPYGPPYAGQVMTLPMPWDPVYLANYFGFLQRLSARYGDRPEFLMVCATGPTSVSEEFTEPFDMPSIKKWLSHHYTFTKFFEAWNRTFRTFAELFPNQYVSLSLGIPVAINAEGVYDPNEHGRVVQGVVAEGLATLGRQFVLQSSSLRGVKSHQEAAHELLISFNGRTVTGYLLSTSCEKDARVMGAQGHPPLALMRTITNGMQLNDIGKHVDYIEIYSEDVDAADLQPVLRWGASLFE